MYKFYKITPSFPESRWGPKTDPIQTKTHSKINRYCTGMMSRTLRERSGEQVVSMTAQNTQAKTFGTSAEACADTRKYNQGAGNVGLPKAACLIADASMHL